MKELTIANGKQFFFGAPIWTCRAVNGACIAYHEICQEYEQVCTAGYKEVCENVLRPYAAIKDELAWVVYQQYMSSVGAESKGPLHGSIVSEFQPYYSVDLGSVAVSVGAAAGGEGITDCNHIHLPSSELVRTLQDGDDIIEESDLRWILHELRHVNQCQQIGGRKKYAILWFSQFEITLKLRLDETIRDAISLMSGKGTQYVHDAMPMEHEAEEFAQRILPAVRNSTRQGN